MTTTPRDLSGTTAVVTGAAGGIGLAMAARFGRAGMRIVASDIDEARLTEAVASLVADGVEATAVPADVSQAADNERLAQVAAGISPLGVVCLNAGVVLLDDKLPFLTLHDWEWVLGVNLWGPIHGTRAFLPLLLEQDAGHIVYSASFASLGPARNPYQVSKHGVHALGMAVQAYLATSGSAVGATILYPGPVATEIADSDRRRPARWQERRAEAGTMDGRSRDELAAAAAARGMPPAEVAELVYDAVCTRRRAILTHPALVPHVEAYFADVVSSVRPPTADR